MKIIFFSSKEHIKNIVDASIVYNYVLHIGILHSLH